jgi:hypothetical protein
MCEFKIFSSTAVKMESWKRIVKFPNYEVSDHGRVRNTKGKILKARTRPDKRLMVNIYRKGRHTRKVHQLVYEAFHPPLSTLYFFDQIDHIDCDPQNNRASNLRPSNARLNQLHGCDGTKGYSWCTRSQRWRVTIVVAGKYKHIGYFKTETEAKAVAVRKRQVVYNASEAVYKLLEGVFRLI